MDIVEKATRPQLDRNDTSARMKSRAFQLNFVIGVLEILAWMKYGGDNPWMQGFFVFIAMAQIFSRPDLIATQQVCRAEGDSDGLNKANRLLTLSVILTMTSALMFFLMHFENISQQSRLESAPVQRAENDLDRTKNAFTSALQALTDAGYSNAERLGAKSQEQSLLSQLSRAQERVRQSNASAMASYDKKVDHFWQSRHSNGLLYSSIMTPSCQPKTSSYGLMKTAAHELCAQWKQLKRRSPAAQTDVEVQRIQMDLQALRSLLSHHLAITSAEEQVKMAETAYYSALENSTGSSFVLKPFELMADVVVKLTGLNAQPIHMAAMFFGLVMFVILNSGLLIGEKADNAKSTVVRAKDIHPTENENDSVLTRFMDRSAQFIDGFMGGGSKASDKTPVKPVTAYAQPPETPTAQPFLGHVETPIPVAQDPVEKAPAKQQGFGYKFYDSDNDPNTPQKATPATAATATPSIKKGRQFNTQGFIALLNEMSNGVSMIQAAKTVGINKGRASHYVNKHAIPAGLIIVQDNERRVQLQPLKNLEAMIAAGEPIKTALEKLHG